MEAGPLHEKEGRPPSNRFGRILPSKTGPRSPRCLRFGFRLGDQRQRPETASCRSPRERGYSLPVKDRPSHARTAGNDPHRPTRRFSARRIVPIKARAHRSFVASEATATQVGEYDEGGESRTPTVLVLSRSRGCPLVHRDHHVDNRGIDEDKGPDEEKGAPFRPLPKRAVAHPDGKLKPEELLRITVDAHAD